MIAPAELIFQIKMFSVDYWAFVKNRIEFHCIEFREVILEKRISFITQMKLNV